MAAGRADKPARWIRLQPPLVLPAVPDAVFWTEHPAAPFTVQNCEVSDRQPEGSREQAACAAFFDKVLEADFSFSEWIDCHAQSIARSG